MPVKIEDISNQHWRTRITGQRTLTIEALNETEPSATDPSEQGREQDESQPDHDHDTYHPPVNGVPDKCEVEPAEEGRG